MSADYREGYAVKKETGGGILLDDIHEYDLLFWFLNFKEPIDAHIVKSRAGNVTIDSEDVASSIFTFEDGCVGTVTSDYLSQPYRRNMLIVGERGNIVWNYNENIVWLETAHGRGNIFEIKDYDTNRMYKEEIQYFMKSVGERRETQNPISRAASLLKKICIAKS